MSLLKRIRSKKEIMLITHRRPSHNVLTSRAVGIDTPKDEYVFLQYFVETFGHPPEKKKRK